MRVYVCQWRGGGGEDGWDSCVPVQPEGVLSALLAMQMHEEGLSPSDLP